MKGLKGVIVNGYGKMGHMICDVIKETPELALAAVVDSRYHSGNFSVSGENNIPVGINFQNLSEEDKKSAGVIIDFSSPEGTREAVDVAFQYKTPLVIGTTGIEDGSPLMGRIATAAKDLPIVMSANMSVGVNLLYSILPEVVRILGTAYDIEVIEAHHRRKKDAPSGTAWAIAKLLCESMDLDPDEALCHGRHGTTGERPAGTIGIHAVRGGDIVGEHTVVFAGEGERIEIIHRAHSRTVFAQGAVRAALYVTIPNIPPGLYSMEEVLNDQRGPGGHLLS